jgi:hypothetical protein
MALGAGTALPRMESSKALLQNNLQNLPRAAHSGSFDLINVALLL